MRNSTDAEPDPVADPRGGPTLVDAFDAVLFDLDGVVYVGSHAVPGAVAAINGLHARGVSCGYVTNNASRPAASVAEHLQELGIPATLTEVITSPQAAVSLLPQFIAAGSAVLVIGGAGIDEALQARGYRPVRSLAEEPAAVMQGFSPDVSWRDLAEATFAVRLGLPWIATNPDLTFPTPRGVAPGNGALVQVVARTVGRGPDAVAGKPEAPLLHEAIARLGARSPLMVGDRLDTDVAAGSRVGIPTLLVFTGVTTVEEVLRAVPEERPTFMGPDLGTLGEPYPTVTVEQAGARAGCGQAVAAVEGGRLQVECAGSHWDGMRAAAALAWRQADDGVHLDHGPALATLADARVRG